MGFLTASANQDTLNMDVGRLREGLGCVQNPHAVRVVLQYRATANLSSAILLWPIPVDRHSLHILYKAVVAPSYLQHASLQQQTRAYHNNKLVWRKVLPPTGLPKLPQQNWPHPNASNILPTMPNTTATTTACSACRHHQLGRHDVESLWG